MDEDELRARLAALEAMVFGLIEREAQQAFAAGGLDAVRGLSTGLGEIVVQVASNLTEDQAKMTRRLFESALNTLEVRLFPSQSGGKAN